MVLLPGCQDPNWVARVGSDTLTQEHLQREMPAGISAADSLRLAQQYIDSWVRERVLARAATDSLAYLDQTLRPVLEDYRRKLLIEALNEYWVESQLDTSVAPSEVSAYYQQNREEFRAHTAYYRYQHLMLPPEEAGRSPWKERMARVGRIAPAEARQLASELNTLAVPLWKLDTLWDNGNGLAEVESRTSQNLRQGALGRVELLKDTSRAPEWRHAVCVTEIITSGAFLPFESAEPAARRAILLRRRHELLTRLEQQLLSTTYAPITEIRGQNH